MEAPTPRYPNLRRYATGALRDVRIVWCVMFIYWGGCHVLGAPLSISKTLAIGFLITWPALSLVRALLNLRDR